MSGTYERTFTVSVPPEAAWRACADPEELARWYFPPLGTAEGEARFELFGAEVKLELLEVDPPRRLRYRQVGGSPTGAHGPIETCTTFEAVGEGDGTRITIVHSGFGEGEDWEVVLEQMTRGSDETVADMILYLETGVGVPRHPTERSFPGIQGREVPAGLMVHAVDPGAWGDRLGLQRGDILVDVGGAPVFGYAELWAVTRMTQPGAEMAAAWVRDRALHRATATLGPWPARMVAS